NLQINDIIILNNGLTSICSKYHLVYVNLFDLLKTKENKLDTAYTFDGIHLNGKGYLIWKKAIEKYIVN
ncbi:MAG TPA: hypothetical protein VGQ59_18235, partial [Cyclobacteriaceae bacterium]|nr:hypothetical protein [Cyclobacteriaceae bacterium]